VDTGSKFLGMEKKSCVRRGRRGWDLNIPADSCHSYVDLGNRVGHLAGIHTWEDIHEAVGGLDSVQLARARRSH
jgi:hypothetical protein